MTYQDSSKQQPSSAGIAVTGGGAWPQPRSDSAWADVVRDVGVAPLLTGFFQGFATVAIAHWRERRAAKHVGEKGVVAQNITDELPTVFIGPQ